MSTFLIQEVRESQRWKILQLYEQCGYPHGIEPADLLLAARNDGVFVGTVRLAVENDVLVLRGIQVLPGYQRQGAGKELLNACLSRIGDSECYCIPWSHLEKFYGAKGFSRVEPENAPEFLSERYQSYISEGYDVIRMRKTSEGAAAGRKQSVI